jgi:hypothetical protein
VNTYQPNKRAQECLHRDEFLSACEDMGVPREDAIRYCKYRKYFGNADLYRVGAQGRHFYDVDPIVRWTR